MSGARVPAARLVVTVRLHEHARHHLLATELLACARKEGLAGATLLPVVPPGSAPGRQQHWRGSHTDVHLELVVVDLPERVERFVAAHAALLAGHEVRVEPVEMFRA